MKNNLREEYIQEVMSDRKRMTARIRELEKQLADAVNGIVPEDARLEPSLIEMESTVSASTGEPMVTMRWMTHVAVFKVEDARQHAFDLLKVCEAAVSDAFVVHFFKNVLKAPIEDVGVVIVEFRNYRQRLEERDRRAEEQGKGGDAVGETEIK